LPRLNIAQTDNQKMDCILLNASFRDCFNDIIGILEQQIEADTKIYIGENTITIPGGRILNIVWGLAGSCRAMYARFTACKMTKKWFDDYNFNELRFSTTALAVGYIIITQPMQYGCCLKDNLVFMTKGVESMTGVDKVIKIDNKLFHLTLVFGYGQYSTHILYDYSNYSTLEVRTAVENAFGNSHELLSSIFRMFTWPPSDPAGMFDRQCCPILADDKINEAGLLMKELIAHYESKYKK
jgi:hypothetical protein